jgi:hypothetical protein
MSNTHEHQEPCQPGSTGDVTGNCTPTTGEGCAPEATDRRGSDRRKQGVLDRRNGADRRDMSKCEKVDVERRAADRRQVAADRRSGQDRRILNDAEQTNLERRRGPGRRLSEFVRSAEEGEMSKEQFMFLMAIEAFKRSNGKSFPTWSDVLEVVRKLGYRKTAASELNLGGRVEDWRERADAPSNTTHSEANPIEEYRRAA